MGFFSGLFGADDAADAQTYATNEASRIAEETLAQQRQIYDEQVARTDPFRKVGLGGLAGLAKLSSPGGQAEYLENYYQSPSFMAQAQAAQNQQLAASEATGGLQSTSTANQLARISPTLGQQALQQQLGIYGNLSNIGLSATGAQGVYGSQYGQQIGQTGQQQAGLQLQQGQIAAQEKLAPWQSLDALTGIGLGAYGLGLFGGGGAA